MAIPLGPELGPERQVNFRAIVFLAAVAAAFGFALLALNAPEATPELKARDALARLAPRPARPDVMLVAMDASSIAKYGAVKRWPRSVLATALKRVEEGKPKAVVLDLALTERTQTGDEGLWRTMANSKNVLLGMGYNASRDNSYTPGDIRGLVFLEKFALAGNLTLASTLPEFTYADFEPPVSDFVGSARGVGVFDRETDPDGVLRRSRLFYRSTVSYPPATEPIRGKFPQSKLDDGKPVALTNLALIASLAAFNVGKDVVVVDSGDIVRIAGKLDPPVIIPIDSEGRTTVRYAPAGSLPTVSFVDVATGKTKPEVFADKVVVFGATAPDDEATSATATPVGDLPRVEVTANAISTLLDRDYVRVVGEHRNLTLGVMIFVGLISGLALMLVSGARAVLVTVGLLLAYGIVVWILFTSAHLLLPIWPAFLTILTTFLIGLLLYLGPMRPRRLQASPTYIAPEDAAA